MADPTPLPTDKPEDPRAPADGYQLMNEVLGDDYFVTPLPHAQASMNLLVVGADGVATCWRIHRVLASVVWMQLARLRERFVLVKWVPHDYNPFEAAA